MKHSIHVLLLVTTMCEVILAKPQNVQIEKQTLIEAADEDKNEYLHQLPILIEDENAERKAKEILDKIGEVNEKFSKKIKPNTEDDEYDTKLNESNNSDIQQEDKEIIKEFNNEVPEGHTIKRKIFHKVSYLVPNPNMKNSLNNFQGFPFQNQQFPTYQTIDDDSITIYPVNSPQSQNYFSKLGNGYQNNLPTTKQNQFPWPFAQFFPILIKDPFLSVINGFTGIIEYGQAANICAKDKDDKKNELKKNPQRNTRRGKSVGLQSKIVASNNSESSQALKRDPKVKSTKTKQDATDQDDRKLNGTHIEESKIFNLFVKPSTFTRFPETMGNSDNQMIDDIERGPFSHKTPTQITNPGFYINKLRVRHGGVAIAGPGGVATAGGGGTAIVGPGGVAYTKPDGMAIVGPGAKIVSLPEELDLTKLVQDLSNHHHLGENQETGRQLDGEFIMKHDETGSKRIFIPTGGKIVGTGPMIYHHPISIANT